MLHDQKRADGRSKRFKLGWVALLSVVVVIGFCLEIKKYILGATRVELKRYAIVGDFDPSYDKLFPRYYHATGLLRLPYDNIIEPFEAWYAGERNMSRIDYYYGMFPKLHNLYTGELTHSRIKRPKLKTREQRGGCRE